MNNGSRGSKSFPFQHAISGTVVLAGVTLVALSAAVAVLYWGSEPRRDQNRGPSNSQHDLDTYTGTSNDMEHRTTVHDGEYLKSSTYNNGDVVKGGSKEVKTPEHAHATHAVFEPTTLDQLRAQYTTTTKGSSGKPSLTSPAPDYTSTQDERLVVVKNTTELASFLRLCQSSSPPDWARDDETAREQS